MHIAEILHLPERQEANQQQVVAAVQRWLSTHSRWMLIWDNLEDLDLLPRFLPPARQGAILITTRSSALGTLARGIDLAPMGREEGVLLLLRRAKVLEPAATREQMRQLAVRSPTNYAAAEELVTLLGGLPLALDQAGAYIEETGCNLADYFQHYQQQHAHMLSRRGTPEGYHPHSVATTFRLSRERVERERGAAADLLRVCVLLHSEAIPEELFVTGAAHLGPQLEALAADPAQFDQAIAVLRRLSLVQRQAEIHTLSMHRLVQAVLLDIMSETEREQWTRRVTAALDVAFPEVLPTTEHATWKQCERLLPHAMVFLHGVRVEESLTFASLAYKAAQYLRERGRYGEAEPLFQRALLIRERVLGSDHLDVARILNYLAILYTTLGKYEQSQPLYQRALSIRERVLGSQHADVARTLNNLALLYWALGKYEQAEPLYQRALCIYERSVGPDSPSVARTLDNLAVLYSAQGKQAEAEPLYQHALRISERSLGPENPAVAMSLNGLANLSREQGKYAQAEPLYRRALRIREQHLGQEHPETAETLHDLALFWHKQDQLSEAISLTVRALSIRAHSLGDAHPRTVATRALYAQLVQEQRCSEQGEFTQCATQGNQDQFTK